MATRLNQLSKISGLSFTKVKLKPITNIFMPLLLALGCRSAAGKGKNIKILSSGSDSFQVALVNY